MVRPKNLDIDSAFFRLLFCKIFAHEQSCRPSNAGYRPNVGSVMPEAIPDEELAALRKLSESDRSLEPQAYFTEGAWVEVVRGPLAGLRGQLLRKAGHDCLVIRVHLIQQAATVHIEMSEVIPVR